MLLRNPHHPISRLLFIIGAIGLFVVGYYWGNQYQHTNNTEAPPITGILVLPPQQLPDFDLTNPFDEHVSLSSFVGDWIMLTFADLSQAQGHLAVNRLIQIYNSLAAEPQLQQSVRMILVATTDAPNLARDFSQLSPGFDVLSGESDELMRLRAALGMQNTMQSTEIPLFLIDPENELIALFPQDLPPGDIATDLSTINAHPHIIKR